jgi:hypothetical protein
VKTFLRVRPSLCRMGAAVFVLFVVYARRGCAKATPAPLHAISTRCRGGCASRLSHLEIELRAEKSARIPFAAIVQQQDP